METNFQIDRCIVVPTDFSEVCDSALNYAIDLASHLHCKIILLHIFENNHKYSLLTDFLPTNGIEDSEAYYEEIAIKVLYKYAQTKECKYIVPLLKKGKVFETIADIANKLYAQLVILGSHGKVGFQNILGSNALHIIDMCESPVITVHKKAYKSGFKNIVFPVTLLDEDRQKTEFAIKLAHICNSTIHIFAHDEYLLKQQYRLNSVITQIASYLKAEKVKYEIVQIHQNEKSWEEIIIEYSKKINADLIMIISNPKHHYPLFSPKEESILFNVPQIPIMAINYRRTKVHSFFGRFYLGHIRNPY